MKIVLSENQFKELYSVDDRPAFTDVDFIIETEGDDNDDYHLGDPGEPEVHHLYYFYIGERFFDTFYDETYLELFDQYKDQTDCTVFSEAITDTILEKIKTSVLDGSASKILKRVIKNQKVVKFKLSDIKDVFEKHFGNIICHEFLQDIRG